MKIGIEVHVQLNTESKLFCSCPTSGSDEPNSRTCEICIGMPGSKPVINESVIKKAIKVGLALGCKINKKNLFSRKSYFYPDLSKNFQITQYELPLCGEGEFENIKLRRIHVEEDPGALVHKENVTLIDYNRSGIPLIELVTDPDFKDAKEVREFLNKLITLLEYLEVYTRKEDTTLKADANISLEGGERVEIKNITGLKEIEKALNYEAKRQETELAKIQETRGWDAEAGKSYLMRKKETENDYGYIAEPDLPQLDLSEEYIKEIKIPELPNQKIEKFIKKSKLKEYDAKVISSNKILAEMFENISKDIDAEMVAKYLMRDLLGQLDYNNKDISEVAIKEKDIVDLLKLFKDKKINDKIVRDVTIEFVKNGSFDVNKYVEEKGLLMASDSGKLKEWCEEIIKGNSGVVEEYKNGNENSLNFLMGKVMQKSNRTADPNKTRELLKKLIGN
jgi:aspartyl-tRNA(Asn)/glutamyl-tRNA(Gln) amidotransferase subunit B